MMNLFFCVRVYFCSQIYYYYVTLYLRIPFYISYYVIQERKSLKTCDFVILY